MVLAKQWIGKIALSSAVPTGNEQGGTASEPKYTDQLLTIKHANMMGTIINCDVLLARGMDRSAYEGLKIRSIQPIITDIQDVLAAVNAYLAGDIIDHPDRLH